MLTVMAVVKGIELLFKGIYTIATWDENLIKKGQEAKKNIDDINKSYTEANKLVEDFDEKEYRKLQSKKDNETISTEEYERLASINNRLAETFPSLVSGFDEQGNAIINMGDKAGDASNKLNELLEQERELANFQVS
jgi:hypothetical protein